MPLCRDQRAGATRSYADADGDRKAGSAPTGRCRASRPQFGHASWLNSQDRPGCRGTTRGTGTGGLPVQCVLSGHIRGTSVQPVRLWRLSGLLLIRGLGGQVPGGAPFLTWCYLALAPPGGRWRGTSRSAASLHTVHIQTAHLMTLSSRRSSWRCAHRRRYAWQPVGATARSSHARMVVLYSGGGLLLSAATVTATASYAPVQHARPALDWTGAGGDSDHEQS
jgi:hypothetical protein